MVRLMEYDRRISLSDNQQAFLHALLVRPDGSYFKEASSDDLYDAVASLPDSDYAQVALRYLDGLSLEDFEDEYGLPPRHIEMLLCLAADAVAGVMQEEPAAEIVADEVVEEAIYPRESLPIVFVPVKSKRSTASPTNPAYTRDNFVSAAQCRSNPDVFFSTKKKQIETAKETCGRCAVQAICLEVALTYDETLSPKEQKVSGIWGGMTPAERRKELRDRT